MGRGFTMTLFVFTGGREPAAPMMQSPKWPSTGQLSYKLRKDLAGSSSCVKLDHVLNTLSLSFPNSKRMGYYGTRILNT